MTRGPHIILARNVHIGTNKNKILFILDSSKTHDQGDKPQMIKISEAQPSMNKKPARRRQTLDKIDIKFCPFAILKKFAASRPPITKSEEQFFVSADGSPVLHTQMQAVLRSMIQQLSFRPELYNCHSLRIGRGGDMLRMGISVETIKKIGRWKSNSVFRYLCN